MKRYALPECLRGKCDEAAYESLLRRKPQAHVKRDRKRYGHDSCIGEKYRTLIHEGDSNWRAIGIT